MGLKKEQLILQAIEERHASPADIYCHEPPTWRIASSPT